MFVQVDRPNTHTSKFIITEDTCYLHIHDRCITIKYGQHDYKNLSTIEANMATDKHENLYCQKCYIDTSKKDTNKTTFYDKNPIHLFNASITHDADEESNLTPDQRDLLLLHKRFRHINTNHTTYVHKRYFWTKI